MANFRILSSVLINNALQVTSIFLSVLCMALCIRIVTTTNRHSNANGQVEHFNVIMISRLKHYATENPKDWVRFASVLKYAYSVQVHRIAKPSYLSLAIIRLSSSPTAISWSLSPEVSRIDSPFIYRLFVMHKPALPRNVADRSTKKPQAQYRRKYDKHIRSDSRVAAGEYILVECPLLVTTVADLMALTGIPSSRLLARDHNGSSALIPSTSRSTHTVSGVP